MAQIVNRNLTLEEADLAARFFHEQWRPHHIFYRDRQMLLWQYHENPYAHRFSEGLTIKGAFAGEDFIGIFAYIPFMLNRYGARRWGCHLSAWWVNPVYRRGPVAMSMLHELQHRSGFDACLAGINTPVAEGLYERLAWVVLKNIPRAVLPVDEEAFRSLLDLAKGASLDPFKRGLVALPPPVDHNMEITELPSFEGLAQLAWDDFYWKQIAPSQMGPARETAYLVWRYEQIPVFHYQAFVAKKDGMVQGLLVYRVEQVRDRPEKVVRLVDLVSVPAAVVPLVEQLVSAAQAQHAAMVDFFYTNAAHLQSLAFSRFLNACQPDEQSYWYPFLFQPLDHQRNRLNCSWWIKDMDLTDPAARRNFTLMKGDHEFDRPN